MAGMSRNDSTQAMKSILSAYGEDELIDDVEWPDNISGSEDEGAPPSQPRDERTTSSHDTTPVEQHASRKRRGPTKLVSYGADDVEEDEELSGDEDEYDVHSLAQGPFSSVQLVDYNVSISESHMTNIPHVTGSLVESDEKSPSHETASRIELPPEPTAKCSNKLQEKILNEYRKHGGTDINASIQNGKSFRNPSIYEKLITYCNIDEKGTNYPPELYNPLIWGKDSFYDELAKTQKIDMDRREKEKKERTKVEFVTGTKKQTPDGAVVEQKRRSKWDTQPSVVAAKPVVITTTVINPPVVSMTTSSSGVKTTVISATGTLKKSK